MSKHYRKLNLTTQVTIAAKIHLITMQFFLWASKMVCHDDVNVENTSRRLTNISRLILGRVAVYMLEINGTKHMARKRHCFKNSFTFHLY